MKREAVVIVRIPNPGWTEEYVIEQWRSLLEGFDGEPFAWRDDDDFEMRAYFVAGTTEAARFAAHLTNVTGLKVTFEVKPSEN